tara:strand:+ start:729 stop:1478 length:750 start_codon:yes stop_codon:yes gene_type:complete
MSDKLVFNSWVSQKGNETAGFTSNFSDHRDAAIHLQSLITKGEFVDDDFTSKACKAVLQKGGEAPAWALFFCHHKATFGNEFAKKKAARKKEWAKRDAANDALSAEVGDCTPLVDYVYAEFKSRVAWRTNARPPALEIPIPIGKGDPHTLRISVTTMGKPENRGNLSLSLRNPDFTWENRETTETWQGSIVANPLPNRWGQVDSKAQKECEGKFNPRNCHDEVKALLIALNNDPALLASLRFNRKSVAR